MENKLKFILEYDNYDPKDEYKEETRREINLESIRNSIQYKTLLNMGFQEVTSEQQELNNTLKFNRTSNIQSKKGHRKVFYTIHPTGKIRRYDPVIDPTNPREMIEGNGNVLKDFKKPFKKPKDYIKGLKYLIEYLEKKEERGDFR